MLETAAFVSNNSVYFFIMQTQIRRVTYIIMLGAVVISSITTADVETLGVQAQPEIGSRNRACVT